ncbi:MAG: DNA alkylation repair protein [archaeon]
MNKTEIIKQLQSHANPKNVEGMQRFGIQGGKMLGVSVPVVRKMAKQIGKSHTLAQKLWDTGIHEARILAPLIDEVDKVTEAQMDRWVKDFNSWDIVDQCCSNLFDKTPFVYRKAVEWTKRDEEFVKRTGFVLMATSAVHDKKAPDAQFKKFLPIIKKYSTDERNFVKKAVNWALRQIGKRNLALNKKAIKVAKEIQKIDSKAAKWIANDAIRELKSEKIKQMLKRNR